MVVELDYLLFGLGIGIVCLIAYSVIAYYLFEKGQDEESEILTPEPWATNEEE